jgi:hypothetical protein
MLVVAATLWARIADRLALGPAAQWLGFVGLFVNFAILKMPFYNPVLTDVTAFALGLTLVYGSLARKPWVVFLAVLAASFTWPIGALLGTLLLVWPAGAVEMPARRGGGVAVLAAAGAAALFVAWFVWLYTFRGQTARASSHVVPVVPGVVWLGVIGAGLYVFYIVRCLLAGTTFPYLRQALRTVRVRGVLLALAAILPARLIVGVFGEGEPVLSIRRYIGDVVLLGSSRPMLFAVANFAYFGAALLLLLSRDVRAGTADFFRRLGPGWTLFVLGSVGLSLNSESRHLTFSYPVVVAGLAAAADRAGITPRFTVSFAALGLVLSKIWLPLNIDPVAMIDSGGPLMTWHYRRYFINHGPWMSNEAYVFQLGALVVTALLLGFLLRVGRPTGSPVPPTPRG